MAGFYAAVVLYSRDWHQIAQAAGDTPPWPGAPSEWTADQQLLWTLHKEYRAIASAVASRDDDLPEAEVLEHPAELRLWFDDWIEQQKHSSKTGADRAEEHGWVLR